MNKSSVVILLAIAYALGTGTGIFFSYRAINQESEKTQSQEVAVVSQVVSSVTEEVTAEIDIAYGLVRLIDSVQITEDDDYPYGAFCRVNYLPRQDNFAVTFGGSNPHIQESRLASGQSLFGGAEGGNGYSYKVYSTDFDYSGVNGIVHTGGGDAASVMADGHYYFLAGINQDDWIIKKLDPATWETVDSLVLDLDGNHDLLNDMMLSYANGYLIASSLYDATALSGGDQRKSDPFAGMATHNHVITTDLEIVEEFILDDVAHINGSYVVFANGQYHYITGTAFFGDLIVMHYNEDWEYLGYDTLEEWAQWSQGAVFDEATRRYYVAYLDFDMGQDDRVSSATNVVLGIFDESWQLLENIPVTDINFGQGDSSGRPSVILQDEKLYVSYDLETFNTATREENKDWECEVKIYEFITE